MTSTPFTDVLTSSERVETFSYEISSAVLEWVTALALDETDKREVVSLTADKLLARLRSGQLSPRL